MLTTSLSDCTDGQADDSLLGACQKVCFLMFKSYFIILVTEVTIQNGTGAQHPQQKPVQQYTHVSIQDLSKGNQTYCICK